MSTVKWEFCRNGPVWKTKSIQVFSQKYPLGCLAVTSVKQQGASVPAAFISGSQVKSSHLPPITRRFTVFSHNVDLLHENSTIFKAVSQGCSSYINSDGCYHPQQPLETAWWDASASSSAKYTQNVSNGGIASVAWRFIHILVLVYRLLISGC